MQYLLRTLFVAGLVIAVAHGGAKDHDVKCPHETDPVGTKGREFSCYSCLGRDWDNCETGQTCCKTACFKIMDDDHSIIAKGCWAEITDDIKQVPKHKSARSYETSVQLPWANNTLLGGMGYFCTESYCNAASRPVGIVTSMLALLLAMMLALN